VSMCFGYHASASGFSLLLAGCLSAGAEVLRLEVMAGNSPARRFHEHRGWQERVVQLEKRLPEAFSTPGGR
jgi:hypothetical protein